MLARKKPNTAIVKKMRRGQKGLGLISLLKKDLPLQLPRAPRVASPRKTQEFKKPKRLTTNVRKETSNNPRTPSHRIWYGNVARLGSRRLTNLPYPQMMAK